MEINGRKYIPNDIDVTPMDNTGSRRENVGRTYKGFDGFAPIMSNIGKEGFFLHHELRPSVQHCQKGSPAFLERNLQLIKKLNLSHPVLYRLDSGNEHLKRRGAKLQRRRVGSITRDMIGIATKIVTHTEKRVIKIVGGWPWSRVIIAIDH